LVDLRDPALRQVLILMGPGTLGLAATQINVFVNTVLATGEGTGAVSWLNYAFRLMYLPLGIVGVSIATAAIPSISRHAARNDPASMRRDVSNGLAMMLLLNLPATAGLIVLSTPIVAVLFERGAFTADDTRATAAALMCYAVGLTGYSAVKIATPTFYALGESRTPVLVTAGSVILNVALNVWLVRRVGYLGLAAGTSIAALVNASVLLLLLARRLGGLGGRRLAGVLIRTTAATTALSATAFWSHAALGSVLPDGGLAPQSVRLSISITAALVALAIAARVLRLDEFNEIVRAVRSRLAARPGAGR
jgi:putative peptidoglycan lipid II flippase